MNTSKLSPFKPLTAGLAALLAGTIASRAQVFTEPLVLNQATADDLLVSPFASGGLLLAARTTDLGRAVLATDLTASPPVVTPLDTQIGDSPYGRRLGFASASGALFSVGSVNGASGIAWHVRRSLDGGSSWITVDPGWQLASGAAASASGCAADANGNVFVSGWAYDKATSPKQKIFWIVRVSSDLGSTWSTLKFGSGPSDTAAAIHFVPVPPDQRHLGGVFAVGRIGFAATVMRTRNGGTNWSTVGSWSFRADAIATAVTSDASGNFYVGGIAQSKSGGPYNWFVRRSTNGGDTWADMGNPLAAGTDNRLNALAVDGAGNLWVVGAQAYNTSSQAWVMQRWNASTGWSQSPYYPYGLPGTQPVSTANGASLDPISASVHVTGTVKNALGQSYATVLQLSN